MNTDTPIVSFEVEANQGYTDFDGPRRYENVPTRVSIPLPAGAVTTDDAFELRDPEGRPVIATIKPFANWPDGSPRLLEVWFAANLERGRKTRLALHRSKRGSRPAADAEPLGPAKLTISLSLADGSTLSQRVAADGREFSLGSSFRGTIGAKRWSFYSGVEWEIRLINVAADEITPVKSVRLEFDLPGSGPCRLAVRQTAFTAKGHPRLVQRDNPLYVRADAGGMRVVDAAQLGENEENYPPYERGGYVCMVAPWIGISDPQASWALVIHDAIERMPKAWRVDGHKVVIELHPEQSPPLKWRQGMAMYQRVTLVRLAGGADATQLEAAAQSWLRPPIVRIDSDVYRQAGWRIPFRYNPQRFPRTEFHFRDSFNFNWTAGTFDWGDQLQGANKKARNLEYDFVAVAAKEFARTGSAYLLRMCRAAAEHMTHTDFVAFSSDEWKQGGIVHHSMDHNSGSAYPSHMWAEGLTLYHQLSGDPYALDVAKRVGDFYLKYVHERFDVVQGTAREVGWSLIALAAIYDLTREQRYLDGIRRIVDFNIDRGWREFFPTDACFTIGVAIIGFDRTRHFHRDKETRKFILDLLNWMMDERRDGIGLFEYWKDPERGAIPYVQAHLPEALNIGTQLSGDDRYLRAAFRLYQIHQGGGLLTVQPRYETPECGFAAGNHISWMGCLQSFAEKGWLDALQYPEPGRTS